MTWRRRSGSVRQPERRPHRTNTIATQRSTAPVPVVKTEAWPPFRGVGLVLSGFENPLRGELRTKALSLGATVLPDWDPSKGATHLVCAYANTPKFHAVAASGVGVTVRKEWVLVSAARGVRVS